MRKLSIWIPIFFCFAGVFAGPQAAQVLTDKDKTLRSAYALISAADFYCSFFVLEELPPMRITGMEKGSEKGLLRDSESFAFEPAVGLKEGQLLLIVEAGPSLPVVGPVKDLGLLGYRRGRARVIHLEKGWGMARAENICGPVRVGHFVMPLLEKEALLGKDLGYAVAVWKADVLTGKIIFLDSGLIHIAPGQWALIDLGSEAGLGFGQQLTVFRPSDSGSFLEPVGNVIVVDAGRTTSTVKILSAKDAISLGDFVQVK
jgi:hypothetical protein